MKIRKIPRQITLWSLVIGASSIIGFLSFSGMYVLLPFLPLAFASFGLSVAYEGEVYWQNIKGAWNKLFKQDHLKRQLAKDYLLNEFPDTSPLLENFSDANEECPKFFKEYSEQHKLLHTPNANSDQKKQIEKKLRKMEAWFDLQLFIDDKNQIKESELTPEEKEVRAWLLKHPPKWPQFFTDYERQLKLFGQFGHKHLNETSSVLKKQVIKTLSDMEKWFATQLFTNKKDPSTTYENSLSDWLADHKQEQYKSTFAAEHRLFQFVIKPASTLAGLFMDLGTTYLLVEAFSVIPLFIALPFTIWPVLILPMATIAGTAYGLLTYNAVTDIIHNDTLRMWFNKIRNHFINEGATILNVGITVTAIGLVLLALGLTICTAGTWWTVAKETRPLFTWMGKMPTFIMGVINPLITGLSAVVFNLQNTSESLELIDTAARKKGSLVWSTVLSIKKGVHAVLENENWLQLLNPFRLLLTIIMPLRVLLFHGHLVSIGVTSDRMPGVSQFVSALFGYGSEFFEDLHYFVPHDHGHDEEDEEHHEHEHQHKHEQGHRHGHAHEHEHINKKALLKERLSHGSGHNHDLDIPSYILQKILFYPIYALAARWDYYTSQLNSDTSKVLSLERAWDKQMGIAVKEEVTLRANSPKPSADWQMEHVVFRIEKYKNKHLSQVTVGSDIAKKKVAALTELQQNLRANKTSMKDTLETAQKNPVYHTHRFFGSGKTETAMFIDDLPQRVGLMVG